MAKISLKKKKKANYQIKTARRIGNRRIATKKNTLLKKKNEIIKIYSQKKNKGTKKKKNKLRQTVKHFGGSFWRNKQSATITRPPDVVSHIPKKLKTIPSRGESIKLVLQLNKVNKNYCNDEYYLKYFIKSLIFNNYVFEDPNQMPDVDKIVFSEYPDDLNLTTLNVGNNVLKGYPTGLIKKLSIHRIEELIIQQEKTNLGLSQKITIPQKNYAINFYHNLNFIYKNTIVPSFNQYSSIFEKKICKEMSSINLYNNLICYYNEEVNKLGTEIKSLIKINHRQLNIDYENRSDVNGLKRYRDILSDNKYTIVKIQKEILEKSKGSRKGKNPLPDTYINAAYICPLLDEIDNVNPYKVDSKPKNLYIASTGPRKDDINLFLLMLRQQRVTCIIQVTNWKEGSKEKCANYIEQLLSYNENPKNIMLDKSNKYYHKTLINKTFIDRHLLKQQQTDPSQYINENDQFNSITHLQYIGWPDHDIVEPQRLLIFINKYREIRKQYSQMSEPFIPLVHCSAGVGRTGVFIVCNMFLDIFSDDIFLSDDFIRKNDENINDKDTIQNNINKFIPNDLNIGIYNLSEIIWSIIYLLRFCRNNFMVQDPLQFELIFNFCKKVLVALEDYFALIQNFIKPFKLFLLGLINIRFGFCTDLP